MSVEDWRALVPHSLDEIAEVCDSQLFHRANYVYYLYDNGHVVYVGQTSNVMSRMTSHSVGKQRKSFDGAMYRLCDSENEMRKIEAQEIERLRPLLNRRRGLSYELTQQEWLDNHPAYRLGAAFARAREEMASRSLGGS
jgi:predicted GIY-YIG superfamily endonuclease